MSTPPRRPRSVRPGARGENRRASESTAQERFALAPAGGMRPPYPAAPRRREPPPGAEASKPHDSALAQSSDPCSRLLDGDAAFPTTSEGPSQHQDLSVELSKLLGHDPKLCPRGIYVGPELPHSIKAVVNDAFESADNRGANLDARIERPGCAAKSLRAKAANKAPTRRASSADGLSVGSTPTLLRLAGAGHPPAQGVRARARCLRRTARPLVASRPGG
jgi:hypothetical protein